MDINMKDGFKIAVKLSCGHCLLKYRMLRDKLENVCLDVINFFLRKPLLTTVLFSVFLIFVIIVLSIAFIPLLGVLVFVFITLLIEGLVFIVFAIIFSMTIATVVLFVMVILGIKYNTTIIDQSFELPIVESDL